MDADVFEFWDQKLVRSAGFTAADRKWMDSDTIVTDENEKVFNSINSRNASVRNFYMIIFAKKTTRGYLFVDSKEATIISEQSVI